MIESRRSARHFRFGVLGESVRTRRELLDTAVRAETEGYSTFLLRDHFIAEPFGHQLAPWPALTAVAAATTRLRVGTLVCAAAYRHPVLLAKDVATLDVLSEGRVELGLGAGFSQAEYAAAGMAFEPPRVRVERLEEVLRVVKTVLEGGGAAFSGAYHTITDFDAFPKPVQRPHPPLLVAGAGPRLLAAAAQAADIIGLQTVSTHRGMMTREVGDCLPAAVEHKLEGIRAGAGPRFDHVELSMMASVIVTGDRAHAAEQYAARRGWNDTPPATVLTMPSVFIGSTDQIADAMWARRERFGFSYYVVSDRALDATAPVVRQLAGK